MSKYPKINSRVKCRAKKFKSQDGKKCFICGVRTDGKTEIEVDCFRGNDEIVAVCNLHTNQEIIEKYRVQS
jgi:hypothetical protein